MADDLRLRVDIAAGVSGREAVDQLATAVDQLGDAASTSGGQARTAGAGLDALSGAAGQVSAQSRTAAQSLDGVTAAEQRVRSGADQLQAAFATLGLRSASRIEADILEINQALQTLARRADVSGEQFDRAFAAGQARIKTLRAELAGVPGNIDPISQRADHLAGLMGKLGLAFSGVELAREFLRVNVELESLSRTFTAVTGSSKASADEMEYVRAVADRLGLPITEVGKAYAGLTAATKGSAVEGAATRDVFEAVARSMSIAGKSSAETQNALLALSQMASKGVVSMEELRGQLGEALPGALTAVANGFGITTEQLIKLVETGKLTSEELFPALAQGLNGLYGASGELGAQTETLTQRWNHFKNAVAEVFQTIGDAGVVKGLKESLEGLEAVLIGASISTVAVAKTIGVFFAALASGDIGLKGFKQSAIKAFDAIHEEAYDKLRRAAQHNKYFLDSLSDADKAAIKLAQSNTGAAAETAKLGAAAQGAGKHLTQIKVTYAELGEAGEKLTKQTIADAEATKAQTAASVELANAFGTEVEKLAAKAEAGRRNAEAARQVAVQREADLTLSKRQLAAIEAEIGAGNKATEQQQKQIDELKKVIDLRQSDADKAQGQARASAVVAVQAQAEAAAWANNSSRVVELKAAYERAAAALEELRQKNDTSLNGTKALDEAQRQAGIAALAYRDALSDTTRQIQAKSTAEQAQFGIAQAGIRLAIEQQRTILDVARAHGDERGALNALLEMKRLEIQLAELVARAKHAEATAALAAVRAKRDELTATGQLTDAKKLELDALEAGARVKEVEAQISDEVAKRTRELAESMRFAGESAGGMGAGIRGATRDMEQLGQASGLTADQIKRLRDQQQRPSSLGGGGGGGQELTVQQLQAANFTQAEISDYYANRRTSQADQAGNNITRQVSTQGIDNETVARSMGLTGEAVKAFASVYSDLFAEEMAKLRDKLRNVPALSTEGYLTEYSGSVDRAKARAYDQVTRGPASAGSGSASTGGASTGGSAVVASVHQVNIQVGDASAQVQTTSLASAQSLVGVLTHLRERFVSG
jgi:tape measure domain-containing protein